MAKPKALVLTGYGINCDSETKFAFEKAGAAADLVHVNDLIENPHRLIQYQILAFPGGFSYGDDTGAGNALANKMRSHLFDETRRFVDKEKLIIGICNGFQVLANLGLLPALDGKYGERQVALLHNDSARYIDRWVDVEFAGFSSGGKKEAPWTRGVGHIMLPIAHGEGKFYASPRYLGKIKHEGIVAVRYVSGDICESQQLPVNPNGSLENIAGITDISGRVFGLMPHPERAIDFTHLPNWTLLKERYKREEKTCPEEAGGLKIFRNAVEYFAAS